jgi:very-short-patch-repair endonuclease/8-oxo-dGTP pyrophosphatase MutT (NUDIX family)
MPEVRHAVAIAVRRADGLVLAVRRPDEPGEELPGVWGLPATTLREGETPDDGARRLGREKLGVKLTAERSLAEGEQQRPGYTLHMTVVAASMSGEPRLAVGTPDATATLYDGIDWLADDAFRDAAGAGSLCCALLLGLTPGPSPALRERGARRGNMTATRPRHRRQASRLPVNRGTISDARDLRRRMTRSEALLWSALRDRRLDGHKFRRQHPIASFVVDFYCDEAKLVVEVDGPVHDMRRVEDTERQRSLEELGYELARLAAEDVEADLKSVLDKLRERVAARLSPSPARRERGGRRPG